MCDLSTKSQYVFNSTDEDARQAFNLSNGKIKEVQIKLMLSSRTEMQKVIESARNQSLAAFMQAPTPAPVALPAIVPQIVPAAVPEIKKSSSKDRDAKSEKRDKRRSRSRSRDRKERPKDRDKDRDRRDRRHRDRSRSRSRERRDRRRRDRSRSRDRTRSRDRDRKSKDRSRDEKLGAGNGNVGNIHKDPKPVIWENQIKPDPPAIVDLPKAAVSLLGGFVPNLTLEEARRNLSALSVPTNIVNERNGFQNPMDAFGRTRESWPPSARQDNPRNTLDFQSRSNDFQPNKEDNNQNGPRQALLGNFKPNFMENRSQNFNPNMNKGPINRFNPQERQNMDRSNQEPQTNCCVQVQPLYGSYSDIRRFFQGLFITNTGIKYVTDSYGKRNGIVYVRFAYPEGKQQALDKNGAPFRNITVEVMHLDDVVFDSYIPGERFHSDHNQHQSDHDLNERDRQFRVRGITKHFNRNTPQVPPLKSYTCLIVEDLPTYAKEQDILKMFSDYPLTSILIVNKSRHNHVAYVKFNNPDDAKKACAEKVKHIVDSKAVTVKPCKDEEFEAVDAEQNEELNQEPERNVIEIDTDCIVLNSLPLKTNDRDISDFFSDVGVVPTKIHLISNHLGFTGTAYCEFASIPDTATSLEKDGVLLGSNVISVKAISRQEMESMLGLTVPANVAHPPMMQQPNRPPFFQRNNFGMGMRPNFMGPRPPMRRFHPPIHHNSGDPAGCTVLMENVPYKAGLDEILEFFDGFDICTDSVLRRFNDNGTPSGEAKVFFSSPDEAFQAVQDKRGCRIRDRTIYLTQC